MLLCLFSLNGALKLLPERKWRILKIMRKQDFCLMITTGSCLYNGWLFSYFPLKWPDAVISSATNKQGRTAAWVLGIQTVRVTFQCVTPRRPLLWRLLLASGVSTTILCKLEMAYRWRWHSSRRLPASKSLWIFFF